MKREVGFIFLGAVLGIVVCAVYAAVHPKLEERKALKRLAAKEASVRVEAALTLGQLRSQRAVKGLIESLRDSKESVRVAAALALSRIGKPAVKPLTDMLRRQQAPPTSSPAITGYLASEVEAAAWILAAIGKDALPELMPILNSDDFTLRFRVQDAIVKMGSDAVPFLSRQFATTQDTGIRNSIASILGQIGTSAAPALINLLNSAKDVSEKVQLVNALGRIQSPEVVDPLTAYLDDPQVGPSAALALGQTRQPRAVDLLLARIENKQNKTLQGSIALALGYAGDKRAIPHLIKLLDEPTASSNAITSLGMLRAKEAVPKLIQILKTQGEKNVNVAYALGQIGDNSAVEPLIAALKSKDANLRGAAISALMQLRDPKAEQPIRQLLKDPDASVRQRAEWALRSF